MTQIEKTLLMMRFYTCSTWRKKTERSAVNLSLLVQETNISVMTIHTTSMELTKTTLRGTTHMFSDFVHSFSLNIYCGR